MTTATTEIARGWTVAAAEAAIIDSTIDQYRFDNQADRTLARIEGEDGFALFPDADELRSRGIDVEKLAVALRNGLDPLQVAEMVNALSADTINSVLDQLS